MKRYQKIQCNYINVSFECIPWEECARLVQEDNDQNRALNIKLSERYGRTMEKGNWHLTHEGVAFGPDGKVINGQHRLAGAAKAQKDLETIVFRYTDSQKANEAMAVFDSGRARRVADGLAISGVMPGKESKDLTAAGMVLWALASGEDKTPDLQEMADWYKANKEALAWAVSNIPQKRGGAVIRACFALAYTIDRVKTAEFAAQVLEGSGVPGSAAAFWNRATANGDLSTVGGSTARKEVAYRALRILKVALTGEPVPQRLYTTTEAAQWFLNERKSSVVLKSNPQRLAYNAIPEGGAYLRDIAEKIGRHSTGVRGLLAELETGGLVTRPRKGFYVRTDDTTIQQPATAAE